MNNPLLEMTGLPEFSRITADQVEPAIDELLQRNRQEIKRLLESQPEYTWENLVEPLERLDDRL
ncbi:MAG: hypothetical protein PVI52_04845, partial [Chromatiales bacterium]